MLLIRDRFAPYAPLFFDICEHSCKEYQKKKIELTEKKNKSPKHWDDLIVVGQAALRSGTTTVVFAALCLEAFIYDYAARYFSSSYVENYLDKLNLIAKWVVIPKLVLGKEFPRDSQAFERLVKLKRARDTLVHAKSRPAPANSEEEEKLLEALERKETENFENAYRTVIEVLTQLRNLEDDEQRDKWWSLR